MSRLTVTQSFFFIDGSSPRTHSARRWRPPERKRYTAAIFRLAQASTRHAWIRHVIISKVASHQRLTTAARAIWACSSNTTSSLPGRCRIRHRMSKIPPAASSRNRMLAAALSLIARQGYAQTSTAHVARQAGTSESQLIKHFGSKEGLLAALFDMAWANLNAQVEPLAAAHPDPVHCLRAIIALMVARIAVQRRGPPADVVRGPPDSQRRGNGERRILYAS